MNYKVVIDPGHGGNDSGNTGNGLVEKDYALLVSNYIKDRLDDLGIDNIITRNTDRDLSIDERISIIESTYGLDENVLVVSNHLNKGGEEGLEVIYALRDKDDFAEQIANEVEKSGGLVNKYYQLRDNVNTQNDYYPLLRDTPNYETVMIEYGYVDNAKDAKRVSDDYLEYAEAVVRAIALYTKTDYVPLPGDNYYVVKKGDSLYKIANMYGITVDELKKANNLTSNNLDIGQLLLIPSSSKAPSSDQSGTTYVVKKGDTLYKIASEYKVTVDAIKKANNLTSNTLQIGQKLIIPGNSSNTYIVKAGDTLYKIATEYNVTVDEVKRANNLTSNILQIGQKLIIPGSTTNTSYTVKKGDSLYKIANMYGITVNELKKANNLTSDILQIGQILTIPSN